MNAVLWIWRRGLGLAVALHLGVALGSQALAQGSPPSQVSLKPSDQLSREPARNLAALPARPPSTSGHAELALSDLLEKKDPLTLHGLGDSVSIALPIPAGWQIKALTLNLRGVASRALLDNSEMTVAVNGLVVGQLSLLGADGGFLRHIALPPEQLRPGFNEIRLQAAQHSTRNCESNFGTELWSQIDTANSTVAADFTWAAAPVTLDRLNDGFDKASWQKGVRVSVFSASAPSPLFLRALGLVAQGIGKRYDFLPVAIDQTHAIPPLTQVLSNGPRGARLSVVVGTFAQLGPRWRELGLPATAHGPLLGMVAWPADPSRAILVVSGERDADLVTAANLLALPNLPLPHRSWVEVNEIHVPSGTGFESRTEPTDAADGAFSLSALRYHTTTLSGLNSGGMTVRIWGGSWQGRMQLRFHLSYASGMSPQSALNVLANGVLQSSIPLSDPAGGGYENYAVSIPAGALVTGWNMLQFQPILIPQSNGGECRPFFPGNLSLTIYEDTTVQKFSGSALRQPDLGLFAASGAPYTETPLGKDMSITLTDTSEATVSAGMTMMAKLAEIYRGPLIDARLQTRSNEDDRSAIWVGSYDALPRAVKIDLGDPAPAQLPANLPLMDAQQIASPEGQWLARLRQMIRIADGSGRQSLRAKVVLAGFSSDGIAVNSIVDGRTLTAFTAANAPLLQSAVAHLVDYGPWSQLRGSLTIWSPSSDDVQSVPAEDAPFTAYGLRGGLSVWFSQNPWLSLLAVTVLIAIMIFLTTHALRLYRRRNS